MQDSIDCTIYKRNGQYLRVSGVSDGISGEYVNDALVSAEVLDKHGKSVLLLSLENVDGDGTYQALIEDDFDAPIDFYVCRVDIVREPHRAAHFELPITIDRRRLLRT